MAFDQITQPTSTDGAALLSWKIISVSSTSTWKILATKNPPSISPWQLHVYIWWGRTWNATKSSRTARNWTCDEIFPNIWIWYSAKNGWFNWSVWDKAQFQSHIHVFFFFLRNLPYTNSLHVWTEIVVCCYLLFSNKIIRNYVQILAASVMRFNRKMIQSKHYITIWCEWEWK